ncbi:hypothetical protein D515_04420 [Grimontia indica]|uniref:Uncharacterized protein n=1 Tax=Grimontia indica TaxID=1056512 RepID=R1IIL1_9GAMM|nr:hypothetical protein [Grimontia indica]EOD77282.1 hypothetical protein D515_04420 [Grimontia indica]
MHWLVFNFMGLNLLADAMTSIKAYLYERAVSPLLGSLIVSWAAWNYKFLLLWISGMTFPEKLRYVHVLYSSNYEIYWQGILLPFITSMAYLFVFTYPAEWVYRFSLGRQKVLNDLKNEKQENELLTLEQSKAIRNQLAETEKHFEEQIERKDRAVEARDRQIKELQELINEKRGGETNSKEPQQELLDTIKNLQKKVEELENDNSTFRVNTGHNTAESSDISEDFNESQRSAVTITQQKPDEIDNDEDIHNNVSFYFNTDEHTQKRYKRILEGLFLGDKHQRDFGLRPDLFDSTMVQLVLNKLVQKIPETDKYQLTINGKSFYENLNQRQVR